MQKENIVRSNKGFTFVEIIASLILAGILAITGGMLIAQGARGYTLARDNNELTDKTRLALKRIVLEIQNATAIISSEKKKDKKDFVYRNEDNPDNNIYLWDEDGIIRLGLAASKVGSSHILIDNATLDIEPRYLDDTAPDLNYALFHITLTIKYPDSSQGNIIFKTVAYPRKTGVSFISRK